MMSEHENLVLFEVHDGVAQVVLNRPATGNAIDLFLARELMTVMHRCADDPDVRAVMLSGRGERFCVGGDLSSITACGDESPAYVRELLVYLNEAIATIDRLKAPVIAAVQGSLAGAGFALACCCDIVIATESTRFLTAYTKVGLSPDCSMTWFLPRLVGLHRALDLVLTNREIDVVTAERWGIVSRIVSDDGLMQSARETASTLAQAATGALGSAKHLLRASFAESLHTQIFMEGKCLEKTVASSDGKEGMAAFLQRRAPNFYGE
jgi:2-(1,2-epoxy-1,2-dihydrophenyl)acetyl-CoA isomerase